MTVTLNTINNLDLNTFANSVRVDTKSESSPKVNNEFFICRLSEINANGILDAPYMSDFFTIYFLKSGRILKVNQLTVFEISADEIFFTRPGEVKNWQAFEAPEGFLVAFTMDYLLEVIDDQKLVASFDDLLAKSRKKFSLNAYQRKVMNTLLGELLVGFNDQSRHSRELIHFWIFVLLIKSNKIQNELSAKPNNSVQLTKSSDIICRDFILALEENLKDLNQGLTERPMMVKEFADQLNINPTYLSECVRKSSGKSAKALINERLLFLSKCHLLHTTKNISEIAYCLGFESPGYFIRFFKKIMGATPLEFRRVQLGHIAD